MPDARAGSLSHAAREPRQAQPAVSGQIEKLEHELGVPLFSRHGRGIRLSIAGSVLPDRDEAIAQPVQETGEKIRKDRSPARSRFSVGAPPASGRLLVPPFAERFQKTWPQTALHMREGGVSSLLEWVTDKRRDPALLHQPPRLKAFIFRPNPTERMPVVAAPAHRLKNRHHPKILRIRDLGDLPLSCRTWRTPSGGWSGTPGSNTACNCASRSRPTAFPSPRRWSRTASARPISLAPPCRTK